MFSNKEVKDLLNSNGYVLVRQTGSHKIYENADGDSISVRHKDNNRMMMQRIIKEHHLKVR